MTSRRDILVGVACVASAGAAYALRPRQELSILGERSLEEIIPRQFKHWSSEDVTGLVAPKIEGSLASKLYSQTVGRVYRNNTSGDEVMMLLAHGQSTTDELQLHRPESCYPAFGFVLSGNEPTTLSLARGVALPARRLVARAPGRQENIVYWSRIGEFLPVSRREQRRDRLRASLSGYVADGLLARFSALGENTPASLRLLEGFIVSLVAAVPASARDALIGSERAKALANALGQPGR